jgi:hypothetical protein
MLVRTVVRKFAESGADKFVIRVSGIEVEVSRDDIE